MQPETKTADQLILDFLANEEQHNKIIDGKYNGYNTISSLPKTKGAESGRVTRTHRIKSDTSSDIKDVVFIDKHMGSIQISEENRNFEAIKEKVSLDFYRIFAKAASSRLGVLDLAQVKEIINNSSKSQFMSSDDVTFKANSSLIADGSFQNHLIFRSKFVEGYQDFGKQFADHIKANGRPPKEVTVNGETYPVSGLFRNAAIGMVLGDGDWLGPTAENTGFVIENGEAVAVTVDAGGIGRLNELPITLDIYDQYGDVQIYFSALTEQEQSEYLEALEFICSISEEVLRQFVTRNNQWNRLFKLSGSQEELIEDCFLSERDGTKGELEQTAIDENCAILLEDEYAENLVSTIMKRMQAVKELLFNKHYTNEDISQQFLQLSLNQQKLQSLSDNGFIDEMNDLLLQTYNGKKSGWIPLPTAGVINKCQETLDTLSVVGSGAANSTGNWKIHISINPEHMPRAIPIFMQHYLNTKAIAGAGAKMQTMENMRNGQAGKAFALIFPIEMESDKHLSIIYDFLISLDHVFKEEGIEPDDRPMLTTKNIDQDNDNYIKGKYDKPLDFSHYFNYRHETASIMNYDEGEFEKVLDESIKDGILDRKMKDTVLGKKILIKEDIRQDKASQKAFEAMFPHGSCVSSEYVHELPPELRHNPHQIIDIYDSLVLIDQERQVHPQANDLVYSRDLNYQPMLFNNNTNSNGSLQNIQESGFNFYND